MRIKILFIIDNFYLGGGAEKQLFYKAKLLDKSIFDVSICSLGLLMDNYKDSLEAEGIKVFSCPQKGFLDLRCLKNLFFLLKKLNPDIVETILFTADTYGRITAILKKIPIIITSVRNLDIWKKKHHIFVDKILAKKTTHFVVNAKIIGEYIIKKLNIKSDKISVIYNGVDIERFQKRPPPLDLYKKLNIEKDKKIIINVGRFSPQKDHDTLIKAVDIILRKRKDVILILISEGMKESKFPQLIKEMGLYPYIKIQQPTENIQEFYNLSNVAVLTSLYEGCSNFILESMASQLPVVATSVGGNTELVVDEKTGFLVPPKEPQKIAQKLLFLLDNPDIAQRFGYEARRIIEENFHIQKTLKEYQNLYISLYKKYANIICRS